MSWRSDNYISFLHLFIYKFKYKLEINRNQCNIRVISNNDTIMIDNRCRMSLIKRMNENIRVNRGRKKILGGQIFKASIIHSILDPTN